MEFKEQIKQLGEKVVKLRDQILTEEATKSAFIMPFIQYLGYDIFNPMEVVPEFITDYGAKNIEKVDYAILKDGQPILIIECKNHLENLEKHYTQVHKYFNLTKARFALLTNGVEYNFYTDLDNSNKLDEKPFFSFDISKIKDQHIKELIKFHKTGFDLGAILNTASELKYSNAIRNVLMNELTNPSQEFVKYFLKNVYDGKATEKIMIQFTEIVKKTVDQTFNDIVSDRLMSAINQHKQQTTETLQESQSIPEIVDDKIIITEDEMNAFYIVKSILRTRLNPNRINFRNALSYFSILLDDTNRKTVCRIRFNNPNKKYIGIFNNEKIEIKYEVNNLDDIYNYAKELNSTIDFLEREKTKPEVVEINNNV